MCYGKGGIILYYFFIQFMFVMQGDDNISICVIEIQEMRFQLGIFFFGVVYVMLL